MDVVDCHFDITELGDANLEHQRLDPGVETFTAAMICARDWNTLVGVNELLGVWVDVSGKGGDACEGSVVATTVTVFDRTAVLL